MKIFVREREVFIDETFNVKGCVVGVKFFRLFWVPAKRIFLIFWLLIDSAYRLSKDLLYKSYVLPFVFGIHNALKFFFFLELIRGSSTKNST